MKEKRLLNALGQVDKEYIEEASPVQRTKKPGWLKWGAIAACLCLIVAAAFAIPHTPTSTPGDSQHMDAGDPSLDGDPSGYVQSGDLAPMVCVNRALYQIVGNQPDMDGKEDEFIYLGEIISKVSSSQKPTEDFQANDEIIGSKVYLYDGENVVVEINGQYWLYELLYNYLKQTQIINIYKGAASNSYVSPSPGQYYCFIDVKDAREYYYGEDVAYLLTFDLFGNGNDEISDKERNAEYQRLVDLGYQLYETEYWTYFGQGEKEYRTVIVGIFTEEELSNFEVNPNYGYAFRFVTNGDGSGIDVDEDDLITDFTSNYS